MCGIIGYIGKKEAENILVDGLRKLEYRGYDSAGIAVIGDGTLQIEKEEGKLNNLVMALEKNPIHGNVGIGHTRWATHGKPTKENAHPHRSPSGKIAVVHNGIFENYQELKDEYLKGHVFLSNTDTEIAAHLIELFYEEDLCDAVQKAIGKIKGAFALAVVSVDQPDEIIVARKESPLVIGLADGENFIASDVAPLLKYTRRCVYLENGQMAVVKADGVQVTNFRGEVEDAEIHEIEWDSESAEKGGYEHFMIKEIFEQPETFQRVMSGRILNHKVCFQDFNFTKNDIENIQQIYIVACGTAYHSGLVGKTIIEKTVRKPVSVEVASEFRYRDPMLDKNTLVILISQSGETADTLAALKESKQQGATTLAITNVVGSAISREADYVIYLWAGPEISVASTKAYTSMLIALYLLGIYLGDELGSITEKEKTEWLNSLLELPKYAEVLLAEDKVRYIEKIAEMIKQAEHIFYIGRGLDWAVAQEGALKLKEISYIHAEAYAAGELKHGTLALISENTPVISIATQEATLEKMMSNEEEVVSRDAMAIGVIAEHNQHLKKNGYSYIQLPTCSDFVAPVLAAIPLQLLAYFTARARGCNIDQPRNLAKSVTVE